MASDVVAPSIEDLLAPLAWQEFVESVWEQRAHVIHVDKRSRFESLLSIDDFEILVSTLPSADQGWLSLVRERAAKPPLSLFGSDGCVDITQILAAYSRGTTLLLTKVHKRSASIAALCRRIERSLVARSMPLADRIGANAYLTPPRSTGFAPHYDDHCVIVLQICGRKRWRIYGPREPLPVTRFETPVDPAELGPPAMEEDLLPGDVLYIPRGHYHEATAGDCASLHVSLSLNWVTWRDVVTALAGHSTACRRAVDCGALERLGRHDPEILRDLDARLMALRDPSPMPSVVSEVMSRAVRRFELLPDKGLSSVDMLETLGDSTRLRPRRGLLARVSVVGDVATLQFASVTLSAPAALRPVFEAVAVWPEFSARDLPDVEAEYDRLELVRSLVQDGFLVVASSAEKRPQEW